MAALTTTLQVLINNVTANTTLSPGGDSDHDHDHEAHEASVGLRIAAIFILFITSIMGAAVPHVFSRCMTHKSTTAAMTIVSRLGFSLAAGIMLSTALIHCIPEARAISTKEFPFAELVVMATVLFFYMLEVEVSTLAAWCSGTTPGHRHDGETLSVAMKTDEEETSATSAVPVVPSEAVPSPPATPTSECHDHTPAAHVAHAIRSFTMEIGIVVHSIFLGLIVGLSDEYETITLLLIGYSFHGFFETAGAAAVYLDKESQLPLVVQVVMLVVVSFAPSLGVIIGLGVSEASGGAKSEATSAAFNAIAGGMLLYVSLAGCFPFINPEAGHSHGSPKEVKDAAPAVDGDESAAAADDGLGPCTRLLVRWSCHLLLVVGAGAMAALALTEGEHGEGGHGH